MADVKKAQAALQELQARARTLEKDLEQVGSEIAAKQSAMGAAVLDSPGEAAKLQSEINSLEVKARQWQAAQKELNTRLALAQAAYEQARLEVAAARVNELNTILERDSKAVGAQIGEACKGLEALALAQDELRSILAQYRGALPSPSDKIGVGYASLAENLRLNFGNV